MGASCSKHIASSCCAKSVRHPKDRKFSLISPPDITEIKGNLSYTNDTLLSAWDNAIGDFVDALDWVNEFSDAPLINLKKVSIGADFGVCDDILGLIGKAVTIQRTEIARAFHTRNTKRQFPLGFLGKRGDKTLWPRSRKYSTEWKCQRATEVRNTAFHYIREIFGGARAPSTRHVRTSIADAIDAAFTAAAAGEYTHIRYTTKELAESRDHLRWVYRLRTTPIPSSAKRCIKEGMGREYLEYVIHGWNGKPPAPRGKKRVCSACGRGGCRKGKHGCRGRK